MLYVKVYGFNTFAVNNELAPGYIVAIDVDDDGIPYCVNDNGYIFKRGDLYEDWT